MNCLRDVFLKYFFNINKLFLSKFINFFLFFFLIKKRENRERTIGGDNCECATIYNNLGCCMQKLDRTMEAITYFDLANAIFDLELG